MYSSKRATPDMVFTSECDSFRNKKRRRIGEYIRRPYCLVTPLFHKEYCDEEDIKGTTDMSRLWRMDSSSSDDSIEDEPPVASEDDKKFMEEALKVAKSSPDPHKQVCGIHSTLIEECEFRNTNLITVYMWCALSGCNVV